MAWGLFLTHLIVNGPDWDRAAKYCLSSLDNCVTLSTRMCNWSTPYRKRTVRDISPAPYDSGSRAPLIGSTCRRWWRVFRGVCCYDITAGRWALGTEIKDATIWFVQRLQVHHHPFFVARKELGKTILQRMLRCSGNLHMHYRLKYLCRLSLRLSITPLGML